MFNPGASDEVRAVMVEYAERFEAAARANPGLTTALCGPLNEIFPSKAHAEYVRMSWAATPEEARQIAEAFLEK